MDLSTNGFLVPATALVADNAFTINAGAGFRVPDLIANLRVDQQWGFAGISAALHEGWPATRSATPPSKVLPSCPRPARGPPVPVLDDQGVWSAMVRWQRNFYP